jgi:hypothetical protein
MAERLTDGFRRHSLERRAFDLIELLGDMPEGGSVAECMDKLGWNRHQFQTALAYARETVCVELNLAIPHPVPDDGYRYHVTGDWIGVDGAPAIEAGTSFALGQIESRLRSVHRDIQVAKANLDPQSLNGRKVNYLDKHLQRIFSTLGDIGSSVGPVESVRADRTVA